MLDFTNIADNCFMVRMQRFSSECSDVESRAWYNVGHAASWRVAA